MRRSLIAVVMLAGLSSWPAMAEDHLVSAAAQQERLLEQASARAADVALLQQTLSSPAAERAAAALGTSLTPVRAALPALSDGELRDLAQRARNLDANPVAGLDHDVHQLLVIFLIVAIVILVLKAVD